MLFEWFIRSGACESLWILKMSFWCIGTRTTTWLIRNLWVIPFQLKSPLGLAALCACFLMWRNLRGRAGICQTENSFSAPMTFSHKPCSVKLNTKYSNWKQCGISLLPEKYDTLKIQQLHSFSSLFLWCQLYPQDTWPKHLPGSIPACVSLLQVLDPKGELDMVWAWKHK